MNIRKSFNVEVNPKAKKFHRAYETTQLIDRLKLVKASEVITYDELSKEAMGDVTTHGEKNNFLASARQILKKETGIEFKAIHNLGLRRMTDLDKVAKNDKLNAQIVKKSKGGMGSLASVNYQKLPAEAKVTYNKNMTLLNGHRVIGGAEQVAKVVKAVRERKEPLQLKEFSKLFNKKYHKE